MQHPPLDPREASPRPASGRPPEPPVRFDAPGGGTGVGAPEIRLLSELSDAVRQMHASLSLDEVLQVLTDRARTIIGAHVAAATQAIEGEPSGPVGAVSVSDEAAVPRPDPATPDVPGPWTEVARSNRSLRLTREELDADPRWAEARERAPHRLPSRGWLGAPLLGPDGRNIGVVHLADRIEGDFGPADEAILVQLARMASVAVENARLYRAAVEARAKLGWAAHIERIRAAELQAVIDAMGEAVIVFEARGRVNFTNPAADAMFEGRPVQSLADLGARLDGPAGWRAGRDPVELRLRDRPACWIELRLYDVPGPLAGRSPEEPSGRIAVMRDVSTARRERAHRDAFLGILSHELRTPITTVYAGSKVLARGDLEPQTRRELAADVSAEAERLFRLVEDLLVMTRFERGVLELASEPVLLQRVVAAAIRLEQVHWPGTTIVRSGPVDLPAVLGDALYVEQVVRNLLSNAAKYSPPDSEVEVALEETADGVSVHVLDRGTGFSSGEAEDLFELFYRSPATAAQAAGAGIGLFVCRRLVLAMGGAIWARPRRGGGSEFGFTLRRYREGDAPVVADQDPAD